VYLWQIAESMNISEPTLTRKLRHELSDAEKKHYSDIIKKIAAKRR